MLLDDSRKSVMYFFSIRRFQLDQKHPKKNRVAAQCYLLFKIKNLLDVHDFFDQSTLELVKFMFLSVECTTGFANYAKTTTYFLVVKGNCSLSVRKLFCSYASFHITRPFDLRSPRKVSDPFIKIQ